MKLIDLDQKIKASEEKVEKCKKTIERHNVQLEKKLNILSSLNINFDDYKSFWEFKCDNADKSNWHDIAIAYQDVEQKNEDIKTATKKLEDAERILNNWKEKYNAERASEQYINNEIPKVIVDFLDEWAKQTIEFTNKQYIEYKAMAKRLRDEANELVANEEDSKNIYMNYAAEQELLKAHNLDKNSIKQQLAHEFGGNGFLTLCLSRGIDCLENEVEREKKAKLIDLMNRVKSITGEIIDADLCVENGDLNGNVYGESGNANVRTIGAGGYNIQRFHFRVLVRKF